MLYQILPVVIVTIACSLLTIEASQKSVQLYSKVGQLVTSSTLIWQSYTGDPKDLQFAVHAAKYTSDDENYQIYVCRALVEGLNTAGHTQKRDSKTVCLVSTHMGARSHHVFDVLLNKGHGGKLTWKAWSKFNPTIPTGSVSATSTGHVSIITYYLLCVTFDFDFILLLLLLLQFCMHLIYYAVARGDEDFPRL